MKTNNSSTKSTPSTTPTQTHPKELEFKRKVKTEGFQNFKAFDEFIQSSLDKFKFVDPMQELYDATGNDANTIISHKSTIPDLVIWNKTFDKNECFEGADCNNNNPFPRFQFYLRVKTNKTNEKTEKKKKDKKTNTKDELSRKESNQDIPTVSLLSNTTTTTESGKVNKDIKDKRKDNKSKMNNTNKKNENKNEKTNKPSDNTNTNNNNTVNKVKPPRTLKDLLDGENNNKPNVTTVDTKQIFNDNNNNNNINNNSINSNSLSNSPFDDIEQDNKMFGQVLTNKNELTTNTNINMNVQQSLNDINNGNNNNTNNNNNNQNRNNTLNQQSNKNFFEQDFNFNNILGDDIKPPKTNQQEPNTFDFDIPHLKDDDNELPSPSAMKSQSHLQNMNTFMDNSEKELQHQQQSYFNNEFNTMNTNTNVNTPPQNILNQLKDNNNNNIMQDNNSQRNEYENMFFKMSNPSPPPQPQLPPSQMNPMHRNINPPSNTMNPMFDIQNNSNPSMQFHMHQEQLEQQQMQQQQQQQQLQHHGNNFLQNMANLNINEQKLKKKQKKPKQQQQPHQFPNPNINNFDNDIHPFQQPSSFPMQNQPHLQQNAFQHEQNSFLQNINSHPNQYQQQLLLQQQQQQQQQQQRQQTEYLLNIVATNFDRKGWSLLGEGGRMFEAFTSYELFQFLKEKINMLDISMLAIADRDKRLMLRGDQMFYILSHTLPIIIQYKQKQLAMFGLQNQNAMNVNPNMGIPPMSNTFTPQIQGMNMNMNVGMNMNMNMNAGMNMNMNMNMANQKKQRKNKK